MNNIWLFFYFNIAFVGNAFAYLDPGSGSLILQGLIAAGLSAALIIKTYWYKLVSLFKKEKNEDKI